jgi:hypothetical protein
LLAGSRDRDTLVDHEVDLGQHLFGRRLAHISAAGVAHAAANGAAEQSGDHQDPALYAGKGGCRAHEFNQLPPAISTYTVATGPAHNPITLMPAGEL